MPTHRSAYAFACGARGGIFRTTVTTRRRAELYRWLAGRRRSVADLLQGPDTLFVLAAADPSSGEDTGQEPQPVVTSLALSRPQAAVSASAGLPDDRHVQAVGRLLRQSAAGTDALAVRLRPPWSALTIENLAGPDGARLSDTHVVLRRHRRAPDYDAATRPISPPVEVLGDPMGNTAREGLPGAHAEARGVARLLGGNCHVQDACTSAQLRGSAAAAGLLWISTHCEAVSDLGELAALRLRDRWMLPSEIATLTVTPGLVVILTACAGARGVPLGNVEEPPLATAFLDAGAALVVAPIRRIRDSVWSPLILRALHEVAEHRTVIPVDFVRALNRLTPADEASPPWILHS